MKNYSPSTKLVIKLFLEFMPLGLFFLTSTEYDFFVSTGVLLAATVVSLILTWWLFQQLALMAIITAATGIISGVLTLILVDPVYVKMKPTVVGGILALILAVGLAIKQPFFKALLGQNLTLTDEGWRVLTWLWLGYFIFITVLNEFIWRTYSTEFWIAFKAFGLMPMTVIYALPQIYLLRRYQPSPEIPTSDPAETMHSGRGTDAAQADATAKSTL